MPLIVRARLGPYEISGLLGPGGTSPRTEIRVILNWFEELKAKVPVGK